MRNLYFLLMLVLGLFVNKFTIASDFYWIGKNSDWHNPENWSNTINGQSVKSIPSEKDNVYITQASIIYLKQDAVVNNIYITQGAQIYLEQTANLFCYGNVQTENTRFTGAGKIVFSGKGYIKLVSGLFDNPLIFAEGSAYNLQSDLWTKGEITFRNNALFNSGNYILVSKQIIIESIEKTDQIDFGKSLIICDEIKNSNQLKNFTAQLIHKDLSANERTTCGTIPFTVTAVVTSNYNGQHVSCNGACDATVCANVVGGVGPFNYQWVTGPNTPCWSGKCAGTFLVVVFDMGQGGTPCNAQVSVIEPSPLTLFSWTGTNPSCNGVCDGTATPIIIGGTPGYTYLWGSGETTQTATQLCVGVNTLTVTDINNCSFDTTFFILTPTPVSPNVNVINASCFGVCDGIATANPSGGNGAPYTYSWSNSFTGNPNTGLCAGNYSVTVFDNQGCPGTENFTVTEPLAININLINQTNLICNGICSGSLTVSASNGTTPYSYQWYSMPGNVLLPGQTSATASGLCAGQYYVIVTDANGCSQQSATFTLTEPSAVLVNATATDILCFGQCNGILSANISGGTPGYTVTWIDASTGNPVGTGNPLNGLCAGNYFTQVQDANGCLVNSNVVTINEPPQLQLSVNTNNTICHNDCNGTASVNTATGGTGVLTVTWHQSPSGNQIGTGNSINGLCAGNYFAQLTDANGCQIQENFTINEPQPYSFVLNTNNALCNGQCNGSASVTGISGENGNYTVTWLPMSVTGTSITNLCAGNYSVTITDQFGCDTTTTFTINEPSPLNLSTSFTDPTCSGLCDGTATVSPSGGTPGYSYVWLNLGNGQLLGQTTATVTGLCPGQYQVTVTDANGCTAVATYTITDPATMSVNITFTPTDCGFCNGTSTAVVSGGTSPYSFVWIDATTGNPIGVTTNPATGLCAGNYYVIVTDANSCSVNSNTIALTPIVVLSGTAIPSNPACFGFCNGSINLTPSGGQSPYSFVWYDQNTGLPIGQTSEDAVGLCAGNYYVIITDVNNCTSPPILASLTEPTQLSASLTSQNTGCPGTCTGQATLTPSGGTPPYSYQWINTQTGTTLPQTTQTINGLCEGTYSGTVVDANGCTSGPYAFTITANPAVTINVNTTHVLCFGQCTGTASVTVTSGSAPFTYVWSNGAPNLPNATNLCAGNYTVSVTDASGCSSGPVPFTITQPLAALSATTTTANILCNGLCNGSATVIASGGTPPYSYSWSNGQTTPVATGLCAGNYSVTVTDANGCIVGPLQVTLTQPPPMVLNTSFTNAACTGLCNGTATANPSGGTPPYSYQWDDALNQTTQTAIQLCAGTYTVVVTDANGCPLTSSPINITEPNVLALNITTIDPLCFNDCNGSATVNISGGTGPYTVQWNDPLNQTTTTASNLCAGNYSVQVNDVNGCTASANTNLNNPAQITATLSSTDATCGVCDGSATINASGGTGLLSILWDAAANNQTTATANNLCAGAYTVTVTDQNNCSQIFSIGVNNPNGEALTVSSTNVSCFGQCDGTATVSYNCSLPPCTVQWNDPGNSTTDNISNLCAGSYTVVVTNAQNCISTATVVITSPQPITPNPSFTNILCNGQCNGTGTVAPAGGTPPYTYLWNDPANQTTSTTFNLCVGTFSVQITDANGCTANASVNITEPTPLTANYNTADVSCFGACNGSATAFPAGGTSPYTYSWNPVGQTTQMATNLCAGQYSITVFDNNGCTYGPQQITINEPIPLNVSISNTHVSCNSFCNGTATALVTGGTAPYTYQWNDPFNQTTATANNLCAGNYIVTVTDANGCVATATVTITEPLPVLINTTPVNADCSGNCNAYILSNVSGGTTPYTYQWNDPGNTTNPDVFNLCSGSYTLTVVDANGCQATTTASVTTPQPLNANLSIQSNITCFGVCDGIIISNTLGGTPPFSYSWNTGATTPSINNLCPGLYSVNIVDANGCTASGSISMGQPQQLIILQISSTDATCGQCNGTASVSAIGGTPPYSYSWNNGATTQVINNVCAGVYGVTVTDANGCMAIISVGVSSSNGETVNINSTDVNCFGACNGSATANTACNSAPCSFIWYDQLTGTPIGQTTPTATNLCAGTYYVQVTNALNCVTIEAITINEPTEIISAATQANILCHGNCTGSITVNPSGGNGPYSIQWDAAAGNSTNPSVVNLCAGTYTVAISDASGCIINDTFNITQPDSLTLSLNTNNVLCNGDCNANATANVSGGVPNYNYNWSNGQTTSTATNLCAGNYSLTVTDANGCSINNNNISITEPNLLTATISTVDNNCFNDCSGTATVNPTGGTPAYSYTWSNGQTTQTANGLCAGNYSVFVTDANNCTTPILPITINQPNVLTFSVIVNDILCGGNCSGSIIITASGGTGPYLYSINGGVSFQISNTFNNLCQGSYNVMVQDANNCQSLIQNVNINEPTSLNATTSSFNADCALSNGAASAFPFGGTPPYSFTWFDNFLNPLGQTTQTAINLAAGIYIAQVTDANGCTAQFSVTVSNNNAPVASANITSVNCNGNCNGSIDVSVNGGIAPYTFLWFPGGQTTEDILNLCAGNYILQITDNVGCIAFGNFTINQNSPIQASIFTTDATCGACNATAGVNASGGAGGYNYLWTTGQNTSSVSNLCAGSYMVQITDNAGCSQTFNLTISNTNAPALSVITTPVSCAGLCDATATVSASGGTLPYSFFWLHDLSTNNSQNNLCAGSYMVQVTDSSGCTSLSNFTISQPQAIHDSIVITPADCGQCNGILALFASGGTPPLTYQWDAAAGNATTQVVQNLCAGVYSVTVTDGNNCSEQFTFSLGNSSAPLITLSTNDVSCNGICDGQANISLSGGVPPYNIIWLDASGNQIGQLINPITALCAGDYFAEVTDANACVAYMQFTITQPQALIASLPDIQDASCGGYCDAIIHVMPIQGTLPYTYQWNDPNNQTTNPATNLCAGNYSVTITDANGCSITQDATVNEPPPIVVNFTPVDASCSTVNDGAVSVLVSGGSGSGYTFAWTGPNNFVSTQQDLTNIFYGMYYLTVTDSAGCQYTDSVFIDALIVVDANAGSDQNICLGAPFILVGTGGTTYVWTDINSNTLSNDDTLIISNPQAGTVSYILTVSTNGCTDSDTVTLTSFPTPVVNAGPDITILQGQNTQIGGNPTTQTGNNVVWSPPVFLQTPTSYNPIANPDTTTTYTVTVTDANGCTASDQMVLTVLPQIVFPNGFSPNGDGVNDAWIIDFIDRFPDCIVEVYNRWGQQLFYSVGYSTPWDGMYEGKPVPIGTYYYIINLNHPLFPNAFTGPLTILR